MEVIINNWELIIAIICGVCCIVEGIVFFIYKPRTIQLASMREWLLFAVIEAERKYKGGTGTIKLRYVYNLAIEKFPWLPKVLTFNKFSDCVDDALEWMRVQLEANKNVKDYVGGENG